MATAATAAILGISVSADAGKGSSFGGGMSRGGSMSRNMGGMHSRSMSGGNISTRNFTTPARGMARPSFGQSNSINSAARYFNGSVPRGRGVSSRNGSHRFPAGPGKVQNAAKGTVLNQVAIGARVKGNSRLSDMLKDGVSAGGKKPVHGGSLAGSRIQSALRERIGARRLPQGKPAGITESLVKRNVNTRDFAKIDRSKLRDLVKGIESRNAARPVERDRGDRLADVSGAKIADALRGGHVGQFNKAGWLANSALPLRPVEKSLLAGGCFPPHHNHWHDHWFGFHTGDVWSGHCHDYYYHDYYDYCRQPNYVASPCIVTLGAYQEVVAVVDAQPNVVDSEVDVDAAIGEPAETATTSEEPTDDEAADAGVTLAVAEAGEAATGESAGQNARENEGEAETGAALAVVASPRNPASQPEFDVELVDVKMLTNGERDANVGPRFQVTVRNAGKRDVNKFLVSLVACKEVQIDSSSIHTSAAIEQLQAGEERTLELTLPVEALSLNQSADGHVAPFNTLIAAVDSDERVNEGDEENNLALIDRVSFKLAIK